MHTMPTLFGERARAIRHASCGSQLWPARLLGMCAGFLCSGCGRPMRSDNVTSFVAALATSQRRCSASCCRPRLCTVSGVPQTTPFARDLSLLPPRRTHRPASRFLSVPIDTTLTFHTHLPHSPSTLTFHSSPLRSRLDSINYNSIGPQGGADFAEGLKGNSTMRSLK